MAGSRGTSTILARSRQPYVRIAQMPTAESIAKCLGGRRSGGAWMAPCPAHDDRQPSLAIVDAQGGKVLVHCHAGCDQRDVVYALCARGIWEPAAHESCLRPNL